MKKQLAFVLGGGASRGAMQVGALRALLEAGYQPDLVTGTSIGATNAAFLAVNGFTLEAVHKLEQVWKSVVDKDMLPSHFWWQTMRMFFTGVRGGSQERVREFAIANGLTPELRFRDLKLVRFYPVAADLNTGCPIIFGRNPDESVLESVLASMSLPPWIAPIEKNGRCLVDGGTVSNLPIEAALLQGAGKIIALDLFDLNDLTVLSHGLGDMILKLDLTVENRQTQLELELAEARRVTVQRISLTAEKPVPIWDFRQTEALIDRGYLLGRQAVEGWTGQKRSRLKAVPGIRPALEEFFEALA